MPQESRLPPPDVSIDEAADWLGQSRATIYNYLHRGELESYKLGRSRRIKRESLLKLVGRDSES